MIPDATPTPSTSNEPAEKRKIPLVMRLFGILCSVLGVFTAFAVIVFAALMAWALQADPSMIIVGTDPTLPVVLLVISYLVTIGNAMALLVFGHSLRKSQRRNAVRWSHVLIGTSVIQILLKIMLQGIDTTLISDAIQLLILVAISVTVDPSLRQERALKKRMQDMVDREAAEEGMLGRDLEGKGYIELNFFNLFWVFVICCFLGLIIETVYHFAVVVPGEIQDRAGLLFGPFSPIYGFGAVLMTVALNRFYKANPVIIFLVSAVIGGLFEAATAWFMEMGFGAVAWDYSGSTIFGLFPDPIAVIFGGRTSALFMCMWGVLGFVWIKLCLPWMLKLINLIPWKIRYSFTTLCAVLMLVNGVMTLEALDCWFERLSGIPQTTPVEQFYAERYDNDYMAHRFESMTITPDDSARVDGAARAANVEVDEEFLEGAADATFEDDEL
ncbi:putative ABC transporter permease [Thermophilibacter provencensis]|uniref:ABC transporter permease n=1 Tax=Thermophilibacter provencensis TaxID=1852386 RepID=A0ABT7V0R2_9ACTN|nr:putative ABC transporter permease [Thermophilibacter provencensis]MDM8270197.1 putative ABC transporter permease [Thermophilibacter provencensis]